MDCDASAHFINETSAIFDYPSIFNFTHKWLLLQSDFSNDTINFLARLNINIDAEITYVDLSNDRSYKLYDVYHTGRYHHGRFIIEHLGCWDVNGGFNLLPRKYKYVQRSNMTGVVLKCMIVVRNHVKYRFTKFVSNPIDPHIDSFSRFNFALLLHLKDIYNFSFYMMRTLSWGYMQNGSFDGMVGQLERRKIDIGGSPIFFRLERAKVTGYTIQTWISRSCFIFRHPKRASIFKIYTRPLEDNVWCCIFGTVFITSTTVYLLFKIQGRIIFAADEGSLSGVLLFIFGAIFQQGMTSSLPMLSGRVVIFTIFTFSLLLYQFYSASIVSSLLMDPPRTIRTPTDLINSNLQLGVEDVPYTTNAFRQTNDEVAIQLYRKKVSNDKINNFFHPDEGLQMVKNGGFAFFVDNAVAYKIIADTFSEQQVCELSEINLFPTQKTMAIVQKHSPFRKLVTYGLRKVAESGLMARQMSIWSAKRPKCVKSIDSSKFNVTIIEFSSVLIFLLIGMIFSVFFLFLEIVNRKFN
ncbi:ionotropic receptor 64a [Arctopsyche grandis]|uniref:ionotropic receptor 64a n=1 Tax=Arctopsyche grandis TaxID=121162 RepID=UPI00406D7E4D